MGKRYGAVFFFVLLLGTQTPASAQWAQDTTFKPTSPDFFGNVHGVAVDPDGKIWIQPYYPTVTIPVSRDVGNDGVADETTTSVVYVYNADGTPADFNPLIYIEYEDGTPTDTLGTGWTGSKYEYNSGRGIESSIADGHILISQFNTLYKVDYKTGKGLAKVVPLADHGAGALTEASTDEFGNVYVGGVVATDVPIMIFDSNLENGQILFRTPEGFSRDFQVSPDGNTVWWAGYTNGAVYKYSRADEFSPFDAVPDTVLRGMRSESFDVHPVTGHLWAAAGSVNDFPDEPWYVQTWYAFDPGTLGTQDEVPVDSIKWVPGTVGDPFDSARPRGLDFSPDGNTAYVAGFSAGETEVDVQKFVKEGSVSTEPYGASGLPEGYALQQNYPNPFNPTTQITFSIGEPGMVRLAVYDMAGRQVASIVNQPYSAGVHTVEFDATGLSSGLYVYALESNGVRIANRMTLMK